jgi:hypothetical protein
MISIIIGWILVLLGIVAYVGALIVWLRSQFASGSTTAATPQFRDPDLGLVAEALDKLAKVLDSFAKLSVPVQWALLGLTQIGIGSYLMINKPF